MNKISKWQAIFWREFLSYFNSPIAYIFIVVFIVLNCGLYMTNFFLIGQADMRYFFELMPIILGVFIPAVTMRMWAEEKKGNTYELLLTFPMTSTQIVLGKFFSGMLFYVIAVIGTFGIPVMLYMTGQPDPGAIWGGYIGILLLGMMYLSIGIFVSGLCKDQIIAFIGSMVICFVFFLTGLDFMATTIDGWLPGVGSFLKMNFGMTPHLSGFQKGVIDVRDVLYFIVMTGLFLTLNGLAVEDRMRPKAKLVFSVSVLVSALISVSFNALVSDITLGRFDWTEDKIYTVNPASKDILASLKAPAKLKLYISPPEKMPTAFKTLEQEITDHLDELKVHSNGNLSYEVFHMTVTELEQSEDKNQDDRLVRKGIVPFEVQSIEEDELGIRLIYAAMAIAYKENKDEIIPRVLPQTLHRLEYDVMSKIYRMTLDKTPTVAMVAPYQQRQIEPQLMNLFQQMGQQIPSEYRDDKFRVMEAVLQYEGYDVRRIRLNETEEIPQQTDTLVVLAPEALTDRQLYEINKFLVEGGSIILAAQSYKYDYSPSMRGVSIIPRPTNHRLNEWLQNYGLGFEEKILMDARHEVLTISSGLGFSSYSMPVKAPMHIIVDQEQMNDGLALTSRLSSMMYFWGSALDVDKIKVKALDLNWQPLFSSSQNSWLIDYKGQPLGARDLSKPNANFLFSYPLAAMITGTFLDAYSGQTIPDWEKESTQAADSDEEVVTRVSTLQPQPGKMILIGNSQIFEEEFIQEGGSLDLFINAVDALTLGDELISIRTHQPINRAVSKLTKTEKLWFRFLTVFLLPIIVILIGSIRAIVRRKEKERYVQAV